MADRRLFPAWCAAKRYRKALSVGDGLDALMRRIAGEGVDDKPMLHRLWLNWDMVMGPELAPMAFPLGHRRDVLLVGGEDNMVLNELTFRKDEILERVNAFMGSKAFKRVELSLAMGRSDLTAVPDTSPKMPSRPEPVAPAGFSGRLSLDPETPVGRFYAACLERFGRKDGPRMPDCQPGRFHVQ